MTGLRLHIVLLLSGLLMLGACSSIKIETGATPEEKGAVADRQASDLRTTWTANFSRASRYQKADLLKAHIDSTSERLYGLGGQFAREWRKGNEGRGQTIPADEMRQVFENSVASQRSILKAWEDNLEYGWEWVRDSGQFNQTMYDLYEQMVDEYYEAYSGVFYPESTVEAYEDRNAESQTRMRNLSDRLESELRRFR